MDDRQAFAYFAALRPNDKLRVPAIALHLPDLVGAPDDLCEVTVVSVETYHTLSGPPWVYVQFYSEEKNALGWLSVEDPSTEAARV